MAKRPKIPCARCGKLLWPDKRRPTPGDQWLCQQCRSPSQRVNPLLWHLGRSTDSTSLVLEQCAGCGTRPRITGTFDDGSTPRALTWDHHVGCQTAGPLSQGTGERAEGPHHVIDATVLPTDKSSRPSRLVIVRDSVEGVLPVWWHLNRGRMWRCPIHGAQAEPQCAHVTAAARALAPELGLAPSRSNASADRSPSGSAT